MLEQGYKLIKLADNSTEEEKITGEPNNWLNNWLKKIKNNIYI